MKNQQINIEQLKVIAGKIVDLIADQRQLAARALLFKGRKTKPLHIALLSGLVVGACLDRNLDYKVEYWLYETLGKALRIEI